jgi:hypothetical protein
VNQAGGQYLIQDPTFGEEFWVSRSARENESSGYFLVAQGVLPSGDGAVDAFQQKTKEGSKRNG